MATNYPTPFAQYPGGNSQDTWLVVGPTSRRRRQRHRKQKRGCRAGLLARLARQPHKPPIPSIFLTNAQSIVHKIDEPQLLLASNNTIQDCRVIIISESWLHPLIPDAAVQLPGRSLHCHYRNADSGKSKGGGLCIYTHNNWCTNSRITHTHCCPDLEAISVVCRPFYLPREITAVVITAVYIPLSANAGIALSLLHDVINKQMRDHPDGAFVVAGNLNTACLRTVLPRFVQYVDCPTRGDNTLDRVYSNLRQAYKAVPLPHLDMSDHLSLLLVPAYIPLRRKAKPETKTVQTWPEGALGQLQDCFLTTDWKVFEHPELQVYTDSVLSYIMHCTDTVTVRKKVQVYPNRKHWMTSAVRALLKARNAAFKSGDGALYSAARSDL